MAQPKKQTSPRKTGLRRSHLLQKLAKRVNGLSPVKVRTTTKQSGKALAKKKPAATTVTPVKKKTAKADATPAK